MISCIIVTYHPDIEKLETCINSIYNQVDSVILVNNDKKFFYSNETRNNLIVINLGDNLGIAYAQNVGIRRAMELNSDYVLLSDQDTEYPDNYVNQFNPFFTNFTECVLFAPRFFNLIKNSYSEIMIGKFNYIEEADDPVYIEHAIASGSIIKTSCFSEIGMMDEKLFIDYVDFEWCWRARAKGYKLLCIPSVIITHQLGDKQRVVFGRKVTERSDMRYYYMIRNGIYLSKKSPYLNKNEKRKLFNRSVIFMFGCIFLNHNIKSVRLVLKAFFDGLTL